MCLVYSVCSMYSAHCSCILYTLVLLTVKIVFAVQIPYSTVRQKKKVLLLENSFVNEKF